MIITIMTIGHTALSVQLSVLSRWGKRLRQCGDTVKNALQTMQQDHNTLYHKDTSLTGRNLSSASMHSTAHSIIPLVACQSVTS